MLQCTSQDLDVLFVWSYADVLCDFKLHCQCWFNLVHVSCHIVWWNLMSSPNDWNWKDGFVILFYGLESIFYDVSCFRCSSFQISDRYYIIDRLVDILALSVLSCASILLLVVLFLRNKKFLTMLLLQNMSIPSVLGNEALHLECGNNCGEGWLTWRVVSLTDEN